MQCVQSEDIGALTRIPGVGRKTAERLVVELRDRLTAPAPSIGGMSAIHVVSPETEAHAALIAMGCTPAEATRLLKAVGPGSHSTEELIRRALQGVAGSE